MGDSTDEFVANLVTLLKERKTAQKAIFDLTVAKEKAETEKDAANEARNKMAIEASGQAIARLDAEARAEKAEARAEKAEKRAEKAEIHEAELESVLTDIMGSIQDVTDLGGEMTLSPGPEAERILDETGHATAYLADLDDDEPTPTALAEVKRSARLEGIREAVYGTPRAVLRTVLVMVTTLFVFIDISFLLSFVGGPVPFWGLMAPYWQPWMGSASVKFISGIVPVITALAWFLLDRKKPKVTVVTKKAVKKMDFTPVKPVPKKVPEAPKVDDIGVALDKLFGE